MCKIKLPFIFVILLLLPGMVSADIKVSILYGKATKENRAALFVFVNDETGRIIKGLGKENFELIVGGERIENFIVEPVSTSQEPISIVLAVDVSGSMKGKPFQKTKEAISIFLDQLDKKDLVSLFSFGTGVKLQSDFTEKRHEIRQKMESLSPVDNWTHLFDATYESIKKARDESKTTRVAVILITDGKATGTQQKKKEEVMSMAKGSGVPVFTIGFGHEIDKEYLEEVSKTSSGIFLSTPTPDEIPELYNRVLDHLKNQYMIEFDFRKAPGIYRANLSVKYENKKIETSKDFHFIPEGEEIPWYKKMTRKEWSLFGLIGTGILGVLLFMSFLIFMQNKNLKRWKSEVGSMLPEHLPGKKEDRECYIEYPESYPTANEYLSSRKGSRTKLASGSVEAFIKADCLRNRIIPLIVDGREIINKLIIARRDESRIVYKDKESIYLWTTNEYVSGPKEGRAGNTMVRYIIDIERFAVEDMGSVNGTFLNGENITGKGEVLLNDGDTIDVGGRQGIRIIYREAGLKEEIYDKVYKGTIKSGE